MGMEENCKKNELKIYSNGKISDAVDGIVNTRHQIAHGIDAGITPSNLKEYFISINNLIDYLCEKCN